jgi:hypothetical protein
MSKRTISVVEASLIEAAITDVMSDPLYPSLINALTRIGLRDEAARSFNYHVACFADDVRAFRKNGFASEDIEFAADRINSFRTRLQKLFTVKRGSMGRKATKPYSWDISF